MRVRVEWQERRTMSADIEVASVEEVQAAWGRRYDSKLVDDIEDMGIEVDGGIDWDSMTVLVARNENGGVAWVDSRDLEVAS